MEGWVNIHTKVDLNVVSLNKDSTIYGKTALIFVKNENDEDNNGYNSDDDDIVYCTLNCRQCDVKSASVQG